MWIVIASIWLAIFATLIVLTVVVLEVRRLNQARANDRRDIAQLLRDVATLNIEAGLTVSVNSVHGIPELNRWPAKPEPQKAEPPRVALRIRVRAWWADVMRWWRRLVNL